MVFEHDKHIIAITETWLNDTVNDCEILPMNYTPHRKDREQTCPGQRGGGILLGVKNVFPSKRRSDLEPECEIMVCEVQPNSCSKMAFILCYRPPGYDKSLFVQYLDATLCKVYKEYVHVCVLGDFNMPDINWSGCDLAESQADNSFVNTVNSHSLDQLNKVPSNSVGNILDLVFTNVCESYSAVTKVDCDFNSDHSILGFSILVKTSSRSGICRTVYNYKRANLEAIRADLCNENLADVVSGANDVNSCLESMVISCYSSNR